MRGGIRKAKTELIKLVADALQTELLLLVEDSFLRHTASTARNCRAASVMVWLNRSEAVRVSARGEVERNQSSRVARWLRAFSLRRMGRIALANVARSAAAATHSAEGGDELGDLACEEDGSMSKSMGGCGDSLMPMMDGGEQLTLL